jgi:hypothetical protein
MRKNPNISLKWNAPRRAAAHPRWYSPKDYNISFLIFQEVLRKKTRDFCVFWWIFNKKYKIFNQKKPPT